MKKRNLSLILAVSLIASLIAVMPIMGSAEAEYIEKKYLAEPIYAEENKAIHIDWLQAYIENPEIEKYRNLTQYITVFNDYGEVGRYTTQGTAYDLPALAASDSSYIVLIGGSFEKQNSFAVIKLYVQEQSNYQDAGYNNTDITEEISVFVNGTRVEFDVPPQIINNRTMVPVRGIFEAMGATVSWIPEEEKILAEKPMAGQYTEDGIAVKEWVVFVIGDYTMHNSYYPWGGYTLDSPPVIIDGRTLVPARAAADAFNYNVSWDESTKTVYITE